MALNLFAPAAQALARTGQFSPLVLADRLITLAQEADRAGYTETASSLVGLMLAVLDENPGTQH